MLQLNKRISPICEKEAVVRDEMATRNQRLFALTELYFLYQFDVHNQAKIVRQIQDLLELSLKEDQS